MNVLTADELSQLQLIVENAHQAGWINEEASLAAEHVGPSVIVTATHGSNVVQKTYPGDARWTFRLLRDLAWGAYRILGHSGKRGIAPHGPRSTT